MRRWPGSARGRPPRPPAGAGPCRRGRPARRGRGATRLVRGACGPQREGAVGCLRPGRAVPWPGLGGWLGSWPGSLRASLLAQLAAVLQRHAAALRVRAWARHGAPAARPQHVSRLVGRRPQPGCQAAPCARSCPPAEGASCCRRRDGGDRHQLAAREAAAAGAAAAGLRRGGPATHLVRAAALPRGGVPPQRAAQVRPSHPHPFPRDPPPRLYWAPLPKAPVGLPVGPCAGAAPWAQYRYWPGRAVAQLWHLHCPCSALARRARLQACRAARCPLTPPLLPPALVLVVAAPTPAAAPAAGCPPRAQVRPAGPLLPPAHAGLPGHQG
jgi:hypothetical protein